MKHGKVMRMVSCVTATLILACGNEAVLRDSNADTLRDRSRTDEAHLSAVANLVGSSPEGVAPLLVYLDGTLSHSSDPNRWVVNYHWDFGDGTPTSDQGWAPHTYANPGTYTATLTVTDNHGQSASTSLILRVLPNRLGPNPVVDFYSPQSGVAPFKVYVDGTRSQGRDRGSWVTHYQWDFGDGSVPSSSGWAEHTYTQPGVYSASLTVTDSAGQVKSKSVDVTVCSPGDSICLDSLSSVRWRRELCAGAVGCTASSLKSDGQGNLLVLVNFSGGPVDVGGGPQGQSRRGAQSIVAKYTADGQFLWSVPVMVAEEGDVFSAFADVYRIVVGNSGEVWAVGFSSGPLDLPWPEPVSGGFVLKLSPSGTLDLLAAVDATDIAIDPEDNVYTSSMGSLSSWRVKDKALVLQWAHPPVELSSQLYIIYIESDASGNILATALDGLNFALVKFAPDGTILWNKRVNTGEPDHWLPQDITLGANGELLLAATFGDGTTMQWGGQATPISRWEASWLLLGDVYGNEGKALPILSTAQPQLGRGNSILTIPTDDTEIPHPILRVWSRSGVLMKSRRVASDGDFYPWHLADQPRQRAAAILGGATYPVSMHTQLTLMSVAY